MKRKSVLDDYAVKAHQHGRLGGVGMGVHAIPDAFAVLHGGVGCKYKTIGDLYVHDLERPSHNMQAYTEMTDADLAGGSARRIGPYLRSWYRRRKPAFMVAATVTYVEMTGEDFGSAVRSLAKTVPCDTAYMPCLGFDGDLYDGYSALVEEVLARVPFADARPDPRVVSLVGYLFDRYEPDQIANLREVRGLITSLGLKPGPVLLSGRPYDELMRAASAGTLVRLPYLRARKRGRPAPGRLAGRRVCDADLPVGVAGTLRWLRDVGRACRVPRDAVERAVEEHAGRADRGLRLFRDFAGARLAGKRVAVFADTPLAAGLATLMAECGLSPALVGLSDTGLGGPAAFRRAVSRTGVRLPGDLELLRAPTLRTLEARLADLCSRGELGAVLGSSVELGCLARVADRRSAPATASTPATDVPVPGRRRRTPMDMRYVPAAIEIGYPSIFHHALVPSPYYGIAGALNLCQRLMNRLGTGSR